MTWKEIKDKIESLGVKDEDVIQYIDIDSTMFGSIKDIEADIKNEEWRINN